MFQLSSSVGTMDLDSTQPIRDYNGLLDPGLKSYFERKGVREHLQSIGQVTESGRVSCTLKELNYFRRYLAGLQARQLQMKLKAEYEEEKREKEEKRKKEAAKREEEREKRKTQAALREQIESTLQMKASQQDQMAAQIERDTKIINREIRLQAQLKQRAAEREEKLEKIRVQRINDEKEQEKKRKELLLKMAKEDVERIEKICKRKEEEREQRKKKLEEFWERKAVQQSKWLEGGFELDRKFAKYREERVKARKAQVWKPEGRGGEALGDISLEETEPFTLPMETLDDKTTQSSSSSETPQEVRVSPTSSNETSLDQLLRKEVQSVASYENLRGNPSREEILTPISSREITLEDILKMETGHSTSSEETLIPETGHNTSSEGTLVQGTETGHSTSSEETLNQRTERGHSTSSEETLNQRTVPQE